MKDHRMKWFGLAQDHQGNRQLIPRNSFMAAGDWGWDVKCQCGWESSTGGALHAEILRRIDDHKSTVDFDAWASNLGGAA